MNKKILAFKKKSSRKDIRRLKNPLCSPIYLILHTLGLDFVAFGKMASSDIISAPFLFQSPQAYTHVSRKEQETMQAAFWSTIE